MLGRWSHPDQMREELTARQYRDWVEYLRHYHHFPDRSDVQWGLLTAVVANQWADSSNRVRPDQCMPYAKAADPLDEEITAEELAQRILGCL